MSGFFFYDKILPSNIGDLIPGVDIVCTNVGTVEHYDCSACGKHFDAEGNEIIDLAILRLEKKGLSAG